jgi:hypothetical protein
LGYDNYERIEEGLRFKFLEIPDLENGLDDMGCKNM